MKGLAPLPSMSRSEATGVSQSSLCTTGTQATPEEAAGDVTSRAAPLYRHVILGLQRLEELDGEWDVERVLETNAAVAVLVGVALGTFVHRRFFAVPAIVGGFLLQHALQGWCPPLPIFRRMGFRTPDEINEERYALKTPRGDFARVAGNGDATHALRALEAARA